MLRFVRNNIWFPHPMVVDKSGILSIGGDLSIERLLLAYHYGIYPWYNVNEPILWWCPKPRYVIFPEAIKVSKSMRSYFNQEKFDVTYNQQFDEVIRQCQIIKRKNQRGTWISEEVIEAYTNLYHMGLVTSVEVWNKAGNLAGGLYGVNIGRVFFGESMFSLESNASKFGFISLARQLALDNYMVIDCQQPNAHLASLGGTFISGQEFHGILKKNRLISLQSTIL
ncbi:MAG: leucyl/phenylalanyl-tRNA--protein transferase [Chitinophagales bacterium]|nr:leucyl/phenylalanyl-tRNA--protein transferase [Chitinophagales bacterium]